MSTTVSIGLQPAPNHVLQAFRGLFTRMRRHGDVGDADFYERYADSPARRLPSDLVEPALDGLTPEFVSSRDALILEMTHQLPSGRIISISLDLYGTGFNDGWAYCYDGQIRVTMGLNDLIRPVHCAPFEEGEIAKHEHDARVVEVIDDASHLFLVACGAVNGDTLHEPVEHAGMYFESGWPSGEGCPMVFHRDIEEFARDFDRIYRSYNSGGTMPLLVNSEGTEWERALPKTRHLFPDAFKPDRMNRDAFIRYAQPDPKGRLAFLDGLTEDDVKRLRGVPRSFLNRVLPECQAVVPCTRFFDCGQRGAALTTFPRWTLWTAYAYLYARAKGQLTGPNNSLSPV